MVHAVYIVVGCVYVGCMLCLTHGVLCGGHGVMFSRFMCAMWWVVCGV